MKKIKIISKIVNEITSFYLEKGTENFQIKVDKAPEKNQYTVFSYGLISLSEKEYDKIKKMTAIHHDVEYDEYWELMGEGENSDELILVSRICDSIEIKYENSILELILKKNI